MTRLSCQACVCSIIHTVTKVIHTHIQRYNGLTPILAKLLVLYLSEECERCLVWLLLLRDLDLLLSLDLLLHLLLSLLLSSLESLLLCECVCVCVCVCVLNFKPSTSLSAPGSAPRTLPSLTTAAVHISPHTHTCMYLHTHACVYLWSWTHTHREGGENVGKSRSALAKAPPGFRKTWRKLQCLPFGHLFWLYRPTHTHTHTHH